MDFDYRLALADIVKGLLHSGLHDEALLQARRLTSRYRNDADGFWLLGKAFLQAGSADQACKSFERCVAIDKDHPYAAVELVLHNNEEDGIDEAIVSLYKIISERPGEAEAFFLLGRIAAVKDLTGERIDYCRQVVSLEPESTQAHLELGRAYFDADRFNDAEAALIKAHKLSPKSARVHHALSVLYWRHGAIAKAASYIQLALEIAPHDVQIIKHYASVMTRVGDLLSVWEALKHYLDTAGEQNELREMFNEVERKVWQPGRPIRQPAGRRTDNRLIVFIGEEPRVRQAKMAFGLQTAGWKTVLLYRQAPNFPVRKYYNEARRYNSQWEALKLAGQYAPLAYHVFSPWYDKTSVTIMRHKPGKVIYDYTDDFAQIKSADAAKGMAYQKYCVENADGLCCRDPRMQHTIIERNYRRQGPVLLFPDFCWDLPDDGGPSPLTDGIHVASVGSFGIEKRGETDNGYLDIARDFAARNIHFHLYPVRRMIWGPMTLFEETFSDYLALAEQTSLVHVHKPVPLESVLTEIKRFHVGASIVRALSYGETLQGYTEAHFAYCGSTRIFDYLDAGLPMVLNKAYGFQYSLLEPYGIAIDATPHMLANGDDYLKPCLTPDMQQRVRRARRDYSIVRNIGHLTRFYESLEGQNAFTGPITQHHSLAC